MLIYTCKRCNWKGNEDEKIIHQPDVGVKQSGEERKVCPKCGSIMFSTESVPDDDGEADAPCDHQWELAFPLDEGNCWVCKKCGEVDDEIWTD